MAQVTLDTIVSLCKRRGFVFQSSEVYGGLSSAWDYGPLGVELKNNIERFWWNEMVRKRRNIVGLDAAILMHPKVWEASGHVENFHDPLVDCKECKARFRADQIDLSAPCPECGAKDSFTEPRQFNLMFKTHLGPVEDESTVVYLRPETAQGIYVNYKNCLQSSRLKVPFGIAQVGKAFRNEIVTKNFIFRTCEFEQMEMQFFVHPSEDKKWFDYWKAERMEYYRKMGIRPEKLRFHQHGPDELAHYAKEAVDIQYEFPFGWRELEGVHNRTDYDLSRHSQFSGKDLSYFDDETRERYIPYIIETSAGLTRSVLMVLSDAYDEEELENGEKRTVLRFHPLIAPITVAVFPLMRRDGLDTYAQNLEEELRDHFNTFYDESGAIGRRYRRQDEVGTPYCITVDYQTLEDDTVTLRYRDSMEQVRVHRNEVVSAIQQAIREYRRVGT
ncbi:glycyl-tRNA synthetase [Spirochaeta thermophila DSM 6578]|uniref:Glycine--tRNA ligase n=1 Tax=Winmispira thermophila (strain ATCC 700085 / DSM 6578 / Z-1203) TaxID=869211 RepID=G0GB46_WINT7|nr:glycine--tRNA ligase [Spirochaeta thermophila]AEJ61070.1 glycyl-tRNA synthetase [Spirochaeta thermophila DSM 6578]